MACSRIGNNHPIVARSNTVKLKALCKNLKTPRVDGLWVCWVDGVLSPNSTEELRIESSAQSKDLAHVDLSSLVASVGWMPPFPPESTCASERKRFYRSPAIYLPEGRPH